MNQRGPLVGHNDNVGYRGQTYHVQTEDSGLRRTNVATHLFADGGRIVHSVKTSYADLVGAPDEVDRVKTLMREQHRAMVNALARGELDGMLASPPPRRETPPMNRAAVAVTPTRADVAATEARGFGARYRGGPPLHALALVALGRLGWRRP